MVKHWLWVFVVDRHSVCGWRRHWKPCQQKTVGVLSRQPESSWQISTSLSQREYRPGDWHVNSLKTLGSGPFRSTGVWILHVQTYRSVFNQVVKLLLFCLYFEDCLNLKPFVSKIKRLFKKKKIFYYVQWKSADHFLIWFVLGIHLNFFLFFSRAEELKQLMHAVRDFSRLYR